MNFNDATCCSTPEQHSPSQVVVYTAFLICIILTCILTLKQSVKFLYEEPSHTYIVISYSASWVSYSLTSICVIGPISL
ncbi:hypothetical protein WDU94_006351 [Cyamophila willieti]